MNKKEISEIRRRQDCKKSNINTIYCCYVNSSKEIIENIEISTGMLSESEGEMYFGLLKKALSGTPEKNLLTISFTTQQVIDSENHRMLMAMRNSALKDQTSREAFFRTVAEKYESDSNYIILAGCDSYDVPRKGRDDAGPDAGDSVFRYIICCICPVKDSKAELGYVATEHGFKCMSSSQRVSAPESGFMFPAFDGRCPNIYNALYYSKDTGMIHPELIDAVFHTEPIMAADDQEKTFSGALADAMEGKCSFELVQAVHGQLRNMVMKHKESGDPEPLEILPEDVGDILEESGADRSQADALEEKCNDGFGEHAALVPSNIMNVKTFKVEAPHIKLTVEPDFSYLIQSRVIDGRKYLLIPADEGVELNGINVSIMKD